jgi:hypothetical protein
MKTTATFVAWLCVAALPRLVSADCQVPKQMTKSQKLPCVQAAGTAIDQPTVSAEQLQNGQDFNAADPAGSRFAYFTADDDVTCFFRPHYAFKSVPGKSLKFQCWHMTPARTFFDEKGASLTPPDVKVVIAKNKDGENRAHLYDKSDTANANEIDADRFKIKYLLPAFPDHNMRYNEVFTEVAASRIMWLLGFPADHEYPARSAACVGCSRDPFGDNLKENKASLHDAPVTFTLVTAERELTWDPIDPEGDETWSWKDAARFYTGGQWTAEQRVNYDAYRLALSLFNYNNAIDIQNRLACAEWQAGGSNPKICTRPMIFVQDLGSTFGKSKSNIFGTNPRGSYGDWQPQTVFTNAASCQLRNPMDGPSSVLKQGQDLLITRLGRLDRDTVKRIFTIARFGMMDQKQIKRLKSGGAADPAAAAIDEWTDTFMSRVAEIKSAQNCRM